MPVTITINGQMLSAERGMTVLEAARANDIYIPTLCWAPRLPSFGGCRMCVVEIDKAPGFPTACTVPVADGMVVHTETPAVQVQRQETLSLLLSEHPYTCLTCGTKTGCVEFQGTIRKAAVTTGCQYCPKNGQCEIQEVVDHTGLKVVPYPITYRNLPVNHDDPFFDRDMNLCIVCGRCVRACSDIRLAHVLALVDRGDHTIVATAAGKSLVEAGCQFCGACVDACPTGAFFDKKSKWEGVPSLFVSSVCPFCSVGCSVTVQARGGRVLRAVGKEGGAANDGEVCIRARFAVVDMVHNGTRLKSPLLRRGVRLVPVTWDAALDAAAQGFRQYRGDEIAVVGSATSTNEDLYALQKLARSVFKTDNIVVATAPPDDGETMGAMRDRGSAVADLRTARTILVVGANPLESHPIVGLEIRHALHKGAHLVVVDPLRTRTAAAATLWLQPHLAADRLLLAALLKALVDQGRIPGLPFLGQAEVADLAQRADVPVALLQSAAAYLADDGPVVVVYGSGVTHQPRAGETIKAIHTLVAALGAGVLGLAGEANMVGAYDMGVHPALNPGYRPAARQGLDFHGVVQGMRSGDIKAVYLAGDVPPLVEWAGLQYLAIQGIAHSDLVKHAQVVLPSATYSEIDGTMTNLEGRVQRLRRVVEPFGQAQPGWWIAAALAARTGESWGYGSAADVMADLARAIPEYAAAAGQFSGDAVRRFEPSRAGYDEAFALDSPGWSANAEYPFTLVVERNRLYYQGLSLTAEVKGMSDVKEENALRISLADAARLGVDSGRPLRVSSPHGSAYWNARVDRSLPEGLVSVSINPLAGSPVFPDWVAQAKVYAVKLEVSD